ncbi:hypothetical protein [Chelativorans sp. YIM 93263]|uniref:hypothetical protein n=1 Tax=Chelativorans sp. YIM 93263 TaxID=2906648 RepID=UPI00237987BA|nr:hypothetical protein [Chelativorans sp. YIM 93263]
MIRVSIGARAQKGTVSGPFGCRFIFSENCYVFATEAFADRDCCCKKADLRPKRASLRRFLRRYSAAGKNNGAYVQVKSAFISHQAREVVCMQWQPWYPAFTRALER